MTITIRYGINTITRGYCAQPTVGDLQRDNVLKAALGFGDNTRVLMNGVQLPPETPLQDGASVSIETAANTKAGTITIRYGINTLTRNYEFTPTAGDLQEDNVLKAALGFSDNTRVLMNGVQLPPETPLQEGATVSIETAANTKA